MIRGNLTDRYGDLVRSLARKIRAGLPDDADVTTEDLEQHGHIGLLEASERWDPQQGKFSTFAYLRIHGAIIDAMRRNDPLGWRVGSKQREIVQTRGMLEQLLGRTPTPAETAEALGVTHQELAAQEDAYHQGIRALSLDTPIAHTEGAIVTLGDTLASTLHDPASIYEQREAIADVRRRVANLDERSKLVIALYYAERRTYQDIAPVIGVSFQHVHRIHNAALERMRADEPNQPSEAPS